MIEFRNVVEDAKVVNFWSNDKNQIAFGRGTRGFIAFNLEPNDMNVTLFTSLPSGIYCDVITGDLAADGKCTGQKVFVDGNGEAEIFVKKDVGVLAIHVAVNWFFVHGSDRTKNGEKIDFYFLAGKRQCESKSCLRMNIKMLLKMKPK